MFYRIGFSSVQAVQGFLLSSERTRKRLIPDIYSCKGLVSTTHSWTQKY